MSTPLKVHQSWEISSGMSAGRLKFVSFYSCTLFINQIMALRKEIADQGPLREYQPFSRVSALVT